MTDLVPIQKGRSTQLSLTKLQDLLDARQQVAETRSVTSTRKSRIEKAKKAFKVNPLETLVEIQSRARALADAFDGTITEESVPLNQDQIDTLSKEFYHLEKLKTELAALEARYREVIFAHLDQTVPKIPGRPASQMPGKVEAKGPGPHYVFERRGGNREDPDLDTDVLRAMLPAELVAEVFGSVHHAAVPAWTELVFNQDRFGELVEVRRIDLDLVAKCLTPGEWRTPTFNKTLVDE